ELAIHLNSPGNDPSIDAVVLNSLLRQIEEHLTVTLEQTKQPYLAMRKQRVVYLRLPYWQQKLQPELQFSSRRIASPGQWNLHFQPIPINLIERCPSRPRFANLDVRPQP